MTVGDLLEELKKHDPKLELCRPLRGTTKFLHVDSVTLHEAELHIVSGTALLEPIGTSERKKFTIVEFKEHRKKK